MTADAVSGMLDIGEHCKICHQRDFLPFVCPMCKVAFCQGHKLEFNDHDCMHKNLNRQDISGLPSSKSVFPDLKKIRASSAMPKVVSKTVVGSSQTLGGGGSLSPLEIALQRLKKLVPSGRKPVGLKMAESVNLRKLAKGDAKIKMEDRMYVWCYGVVDETKSDKRAIWVNKNWSMGKTLDYIAEQLRFQNINNSTLDTDERLFLFDSELTAFTLSKKASASIKEGDTVYLVKGGLSGSL